MGGFDEQAGITGDWMPSSPNLPAFFLGILGDDGGSRPVSEPESPKDDNNTSGFTFPGPDRQIGCENGDESQRGQSLNQTTKPGAFGEQKQNSRSGLVERMAARAGYNAPRLNTDIVRPSADVETRSPYLTISPGLSPTCLLDSPVFLSNSLVQPSPTTGKLPFAPNGNGNGRSSISNENKDNLFEDFNSSSFAFKPVPESAKVEPPFMSWQSFQSIEAAKVQSQNGISLHDGDVDQILSGDNANANGGPSDDGYNWRKYGQKQVKGSEYPRSYYKCTHPNCPVTKKVERSHEGHITEIIYKGAHKHPKPPPSRRSGIGSSGVDGDHEGNLEVTSSTVNGSFTISNDEDEDDRATHGSGSLGCDGEGDESESKRRKVEAYAADVSGASRAIREPRVVVQTTSEVDILDDGYRWRKYGQKVVKGNPNPRSYYKCTSTGCTVRKHVERASHDLKSVITTYEGKHNHDVPAARNSSHVNSQAQSIQSQIHRPEPSSMARFERPSYGLQPGPSGYGYGMNLPGTGLAQMGMAGFGPSHQYLRQPHQMNQMGIMLPKGEPKVEPVSEPSYHHQMMNRLPLGPHM